MVTWLKFGIVASLLLTTRAVGQTLDEYQVKAAFIVKFAAFVEWPAAAFKGPADPLVICVMGRNPFGHQIENMVEGKSVDGRAFAVRAITDGRDAIACHILFVSSSEQRRFGSILDLLKNTSVLPVGDTNDFLAEGGLIILRLEDGKVRIEIDARAAKARNLRVSSRLLELAQGPARSEKCSGIEATQTASRRSSRSACGCEIRTRRLQAP